MKKSKKKRTAKPQQPKVRRLLVITEGGRVVGTQVLAPPPRRAARSTAMLRAGPGQKMHELEIEVPGRLGAHEIQSFHELIAALLAELKSRREPGYCSQLWGDF